MKQNLAIALLALLVIADLAFHGPIVHAQNGSPWAVSFPEGPLSGCPAPKAGFDAFCSVTGSGPEMSINGGAYAPMGQGGQSISFSQITGQLTPTQLPTTLNSSITLSGLSLSNGILTGAATQTVFH